jgi:hypothetical protein
MKKALKKFKQTRINVIFYYILAMILILSFLIVKSDAHKDIRENISFFNYKIYFEKPKLNDIIINNKTFTQISMSNCISYSNIGSPSLPIYPIKILLPQDKDISQINISYKNFIELEYNLSDKPIIPQQEPISTTTSISDTKFLKNDDIYNSLNPVINKIYNVNDINFCRGYAIRTIILFPVQYIPKLGKLYYFPELNININFEKNRSKNIIDGNNMLRDNNKDKDIVKSMIVNPNTINTYMPNSNSKLGVCGICNSSKTYEYVIITNEALNNTISQMYNWSDLLNHRNTYSGLNTTLLTVEDIDDCRAYWNDTELFNDSAAHVREFIKDAYLNWDTQYVLLGGDWVINDENKQIVPTRIFYVWDARFEDYPDMPCDMYFSNLDGTWRDTIHNCWGGGKNSSANDHYAELFVGRMTVSTAEELSNFIKKVIWYDLYTDGDFINKSVFFGGNLGSGYDINSADYMEEIRNGSKSHFYHCEGFTDWNDNNPDYEFNISTRKYYDWGANIPDDYIEIINNNNACIINHIGHGSITSALDMTKIQLESLANTKYFFAYSQQCLSARFTEGDTPEKILTCKNGDNGSFGLIWNTGYGWFNKYSTNGSSQFLQLHFWDYLFNHSTANWEIGAAHTYSKDKISSYVDIPDWHYSWCYSWYSSNLFGDPAQKIKVKSNNSEMSIILKDEIPTNSSINISVGNLTIGINATDPEGDTMNILFRTNFSGMWEDIESNNSVQDGIFTQIHQFNDYNTKYWWSVNASDISGDSGWVNETYHFTTRLKHNVSPPTDFGVQTYNSTQINITWFIGENASHTYIERNVNSSWIRGQGSLIYNDTGTYYHDDNLTPHSIYFYKAWSWDKIDNVWSINNYSTSNTTLNCIPYFYNEKPINGSTDNSINPLLSISINDPDSDNLNISFFTNSTGPWTLIGLNESSSYFIYNQSNNSFNCYLTKYWWSVNCTDGYDWINKTYQFTTGKNNPPIISNENPLNKSTSVSPTKSVITIYIYDQEGNNINWTIETSPNIGKSSQNYDLDGNKICNISNLEYSKTYYWYVNATDIGSGNSTNKKFWFKTNKKNIIIDNIPQNNPPNTPLIPIGKELGYINTIYNYSTTITDINNDLIRIRFDWGDGTYSDWTDFFKPNTPIILEHSWNLSGEYNIRSIAQDEKGEYSRWSDTLTVTIKEKPRQKVEFTVIKKILGNGTIIFDVLLLNGIQEENYIYYFDFGDGINSTAKKPTHHYSSPGIYYVTLVIYDTTGNIVNKTFFKITISSESNIITNIAGKKKQPDIFVIFAILILIFIEFFSILIILFSEKNKN